MTRGERRTRIEDRLARNVAVLFGVEVPDSPVDRTWTADFNRVKVGELARGAPAAYEPAADLDVIATALVHRFKPDTKSALVLVAADRLFESIEPTMGVVLDLLSTSDDGKPLAQCSQVVLWSTMVVDAYLAQPALFAAAVQARAAQRAVAAPWRPQLAPDGPWPTAGLEFSIPTAGGQGQDHPLAELGILDDLMHRMIGPRSPVTAAGRVGSGLGASDAFLTDSTIDRWLRHLLYSGDHGMAWVESDQLGTTAAAFVPRVGAISSFTADALSQYPFVEPMGVRPGEPTAGLVEYDRDDPAHVLRMVPRVPSVPELASLPTPAQHALVRWLTVLSLVLADCSVTSSLTMQAHCLRTLTKLAELSARVLGETELTTMLVAWTRASEELTQRRERSTHAELALLRAEVVDRFDALREAWRADQMTDGEWIEHVIGGSAVLTWLSLDLIVAGDVPRGEAVQAKLLDDWRMVLARLGVPEHSSLADLSHVPGSVAVQLHNYVAFRLRLADLDGRLWALDVGRELVLPQRRELSRQRRSEAAVRTTLQVLVRGASRVVDELPDEERRDHVLDELASWRDELAATSTVHRLERATAPFRVGELACLSALLLAEVTLAEHGRLVADDAMAERVRLLHTIADGLESPGGAGGLHESATEAVQLREIRARFDALLTRDTDPTESAGRLRR